MRERIPVLRTEFGLLLRYHVPWVHARPGKKLVEIEPGNEALYPSADEFEVVDPTPDDERRGIDRNALRRAERDPAEFFVPEPFEKVSLPKIDVVVCPRWRRYGASKNWGAWSNLVKRLSTPNVFAAGAPESSDFVDCPAAWHSARHLDVSIAAMRKAKVAVATTSGLAVLAVLCGTPLVLVTYRGLVAPGPQLDPEGRAMQPSYEPAAPLVRKYMEPVNTTGSPIQLVDGWEDLHVVVEAVELMSDYSTRNREGRLKMSKSW